MDGDTDLWRFFLLDPDTIHEATCPDCDRVITVSGSTVFHGGTPDIGTELDHEPTLGDLVDAASAHVCEGDGGDE